MVPGHDDRQLNDLLSGLPSTVHNPLTVEGRIEQAGKIASGLRKKRRGWRRPVFLIGATAIVAAGLIVILLAAIHQ